MGGCSSKSSTYSNGNNSSRTRNNSDGNDFDEYNHIKVDSINRHDEQFINVIIRDLNENPQIFVLNNILMSIQFFEDYNREIFNQGRTTTRKIENEINKTLLKNETMECSYPDVILDQVNKNVRYRPMHGPKKSVAESLAPKRMFVLADNIEVINTLEAPQYTSIDKPAYQVRIEESRRKGFVRLKQIETNRTPKKETYSDYGYGKSEQSPGTSGKSDSDYDYTTITDLHTPKLLEKTGMPERRDTLPKSCFFQKKVEKSITDVLINTNDDTSVELTEDDLVETVTYIDAKGFMSYFKNALFPNSLGRALGFDEPEIAEAKAIPGKIFCNQLDEDDHVINCEVIPCVSIEWPGEHTFEFVMREERPTITDRRTGIRYRWPTDDMLKDIQSLTCVLVPTGYWKKRGNHTDSNIEWEIAFPKTERYIEARMSHAQIKCLLFLLAIHKCFIEPVTHQQGLLVSHIRTLMYWQCEENYRDWPEHRLGTKLLKVITKLNGHLAKGVLPDYFIKRKNLFENIPKKYLNYAQKVFHDILQAPAMHYIKAVRSLRYTSGRFYPPLDFERLREILVQNQGLNILNPNISTASRLMNRQNRYMDAESQLKHILELRNRNRILEQREQSKENLARNRNREETESVDSIDLNWTDDEQFDVAKVKEILEIFIINFIGTAKKSSDIGSKEQTLFYLKQSWYLVKILKETASAFVVEARKYEDIIKREEVNCKKMAVKEIYFRPPVTPARNSTQLDFAATQQLKSNMVNLSNLSDSYNSTFLHVNQSKQTPRYERYQLKNDFTGRPVNGNGLPRKSVAFV